MPSALVDNELFVDFDEQVSVKDSAGRPLNNAQIAFFNNSKCLSPSGALLVVYHASNKQFSAFKDEFSGSAGGNIFGKGFYFCDSDMGLDIYGEYINEYYLNLKNPFRWEPIEEEADALYNMDMFVEVLEINNFSLSDELRQALEDMALEDCLLDEMIEATCGQDKIQTFLKNAGYDGIMNLDVGDYVAFDPKQIKLCSNTKPTSSAELAA